MADATGASEHERVRRAVLARGSLQEVLHELGEDLDHGTEKLAEALEVDHGVLLGVLLDLAVERPPKLMRRLSTPFGAFDVIAAGSVIAIVAAILAHVVPVVATEARSPPPRPVEEVLRDAGGGEVDLAAGDLAGRTLLALSVAPAAHHFLGELPARLSAAVVPEPPADGAAPRPVHRVDDLLVLRAESADDGVAVLVAVPEAEVPALLESLSGATVHLLRRPAEDEGTSRSPLEGVEMDREGASRQGTP